LSTTSFMIPRTKKPGWNSLSTSRMWKERNKRILMHRLEQGSSWIWSVCTNWSWSAGQVLGS
jgi:hypothetical protein